MQPPPSWGWSSIRLNDVRSGKGNSSSADNPNAACSSWLLWSESCPLSISTDAASSRSSWDSWVRSAGAGVFSNLSPVVMASGVPDFDNERDVRRSFATKESDQQALNAV